MKHSACEYNMMGSCS